MDLCRMDKRRISLRRMKHPAGNKDSLTVTWNWKGAAVWPAEKLFLDLDWAPPWAAPLALHAAPL
jgi:hypothetical protein